MKAIINELLEIMAMAEEAENTLKKKFGGNVVQHAKKKRFIFTKILRLSQKVCPVKCQHLQED